MRWFRFRPQYAATGGLREPRQSRHQGTMSEPDQTWYAATAVAAPERPALTHNLDVDVCIIGAGLAGLTVAREVARRGWSVAMLEAGHVAGGASGRNAGFVSPGFSERIEAIVERVGLPRAKELWALSEAGVEYIRGAVTQTAMPGVEPRDGRLSVRRADDEAGLIEHVAMLRVDFGADVEAWPTDQVREVLRSAYYFQAAHYPKAFHIHPLNYALGLAADDRLLWGGRITARASAPRRFKAQMRRDTLQVYPQLGDVEIEYSWSGTMAYAVHKMPQIGELAPGYWLASAFGGHGLNTTAMAGEMIARAILDGDDRWRLFSSYELVWAGGRAGRVAAQAAYWSMQARDAVQEWISRYRDRARRESDARQARWAAEKAARKAEAEARRAEEDAKRIAEAEARRLAAEEARRRAAEKARLAKEEVERIRQERAWAAAEAKRAEEETARVARDKAAQDAAEAAAALAAQAEEHNTVTAQPESAPVAAEETAPKAAAKSKSRKLRKARAPKKKKELAEP